MHTGIVGHADDHTGIDAGVADGEQRVSCHVQTYVFHAHKAAFAGHAGTESSFHGYFFIGSPFGIYFGVFCHGLGDFSGRSSGVAGYKAAAGLI